MSAPPTFATRILAMAGGSPQEMFTPTLAHNRRSARARHPEFFLSQVNFTVSALPDDAAGNGDRADGLDAVGLVGGLVVAVANEPRVAQREAARVLRRALDVVEGDLHHQLGADVDDVAVATGLSGHQRRGLPGQHLVGHALEGLAEHHPTAGRVARAEV